ncbi:MAG: TonB-dependent receptor domain-containing protein [Bacteroidota bacterium]
MQRGIIIIFLVLSAIQVVAQGDTLRGSVVDRESAAIPGVVVVNQRTEQRTRSNLEGQFSLQAQEGDTLFLRYALYEIRVHVVQPTDFQKEITVEMAYKTQEVAEVEVTRKRLAEFNVGYMPPVKGVRLNNGTNAIIQLEKLSGAKSLGNPREVYAKIPGLNIWENDGAGIQVDIGGRGLSPKRTANFNTRQNGYDISADALGYPESYYTPPVEALSNIEIVRGSAALQFGTQFGGLLNFVIRDPVDHSPFEFTTRNTAGNYGYLSTFNRVSGSTKRTEYQAYHLYKRGNGYRENGSYYQHQAFAEFGYYLTESWKIGMEFTHMNYLAKQPGGLTDKAFEEDPRQSIRDRNWFGVNWNLLALTSAAELGKNGTIDFRAFGMVSDRKSLGFLGKVTQTDNSNSREMIYSDFRNMGAELRYLKKYSLIDNGEDAFQLRGAFVVGARYYQGETETRQGRAPGSDDANFTFLNPTDVENSSFRYPSRNNAVFLENTFFIGEKWRLNLGARLEYIDTRSKGFYKKYSIHPINYDTLQVNKVRDSNRVQRTVPLFGLGTTYKLNSKSSVYLNVTQNYRAINFSDIRVNNPNVVVDTTIRDEYGFTGELGFRGLLNDYLLYDIAAFYLFYGDKIGIAPIPNSIKKQRTNIGDAQNFGLETLLEFDWIEWMKIDDKWGLKTFVNMAYIEANYISSKEPNYVGNKVEYVSPLTLGSGITMDYERLRLKVQVSYNAPQFSDASNAVEPSGDAVIGQVPAYTVVDFSGRYKFKKHFQIEFGVNNLLNENYFTRRATGYPGPGILPAQGINPYFTLQYQFTKGG